MKAQPTMKIGGRLVYRLEDILAFERAMLLGGTRDQVAELDFAG